MEGDKRHRSDGFDLLGALLVLLKRKRLVGAVVATAVVVTAVVSLVIPPSFRAESQILPPQNTTGSMASRIFSQMGAASLLVAPSLDIKNTNDLYGALIRTRTVLDNTVDRFGLMELYGVKTHEDARNALKRRIEVLNDKKSGIMSVTYEDKDPGRAAGVVNFLVSELKRLNSDLAVTEAAQRRLFFETQLKGVKEALIGSEEGLKGFQEKTGVYKIDEQTKAMVEGIARLRAEVAAKEVRLKVARSYQTEGNPELQTLTTELAGLREQLGKLESTGARSGYDTSIPTRNMPRVGIEYIRKMREFKYNEALYEILLKELEGAKLDESRNSSMIQVIEKAVPPERRVRPRRTRMVVIAGIMGAFLAVFSAFFAEYVEDLSGDPANEGRLKAIRRQVFFWRS